MAHMYRMVGVSGGYEEVELPPLPGEEDGGGRLEDLFDDLPQDPTPEQDPLPVYITVAVVGVAVGVGYLLVAR